MTATSYGELLHDVQQRARQLDTQLLTSATVSVALFGIIGGPWGSLGSGRYHTERCQRITGSYLSDNSVPIGFSKRIGETVCRTRAKS